MKKINIWKKAAGFALTLGLLVLPLAACGGEAAPSQPAAEPEQSEPVPSSQPDSEVVIIEEEPPPGIDVVLPEMELLVDAEAGGSTIQVPQFAATALDDDMEALNAEMLTFAGDYQDYVDGHPDGYELTLNAWYSRDSAWASILMLQSHVPIYGTYGDMAVFIYDFWQHRAIPLEEQAEVWAEELTAAEEVLWAGAFLEDDGQFVSDVAFKGVFDGFLLFNVTARYEEEGTEWTYLYGTYDLIDEVEIFDEAALLELFPEE